MQKPTGVRVPPAHEAVPHDVAAEAFWHAPAPSQVPTKPQGGLAAQRPCGSAAAAGTSLHAPSRPAMSQDSQVPQLVAPQHTPSTHALPVRQSASVAQASPRRCLSPQVFFWRSQIAGGAQSPSATQAVLQAEPLQAKGAHDCVLAGLHVPAPSQARPSVCAVAPAGQAGGAQAVPAPKRAQAPLPSQKPVVPQLAAPAFVHELVGSTPPAGTGAQVPGEAARAHDRQVPVQAVRQHTPWAQNPLAHSPPSPQATPGPLRPHEPAVQTAGDAQSASAVQLALHAVAPHRKGKQELAAGVTQAPAPSQVEPGVKVVPPLGQLGAPHGVPWANLWHAPAAHMPFVPQVEAAAAAQVADGSGAPVGTSAHVPIAPASAHDLQASAQADAQQTPCAQKPEPHSEGSEQNEPLPFGPQELALQTLGEAQSVLVVHDPKQRAPLQAKGAQGRAAGATHWPVLLQVEPGV